MLGSANIVLIPAAVVVGVEAQRHLAAAVMWTTELTDALGLDAGPRAGHPG